MNVLFVATRGHGDAADPFLARLGAGLAVRGHHVAQASGDGLVALAGNVRRALERRPVDVLHADSPAAALAAWMGRGERPVPIVASVRPSAGRFQLGTARILATTCGAVAASSRRLADGLVASGLDGQLVTVIYDGIPGDELATIGASLEAREAARQELGLSPEVPAILTMVPDSRDAGHRLLSEAIAKLEPALQARLLVADDDGRGWAPLLAASDVFCQPLARADGPPAPILRAMAAGLPVVSTAVGCVPETVRNGGNGFLVHPRDPAGLARALARLLEDRGLARRMGRFGRDLALSGFSNEGMCRRFEGLYSAALVSGRNAQKGPDGRVLVSGLPFAPPTDSMGRRINETAHA